MDLKQKTLLGMRLIKFMDKPISNLELAKISGENRYHTNLFLKLLVKKGYGEFINDVFTPKLSITIPIVGSFYRYISTDASYCETCEQYKPKIFDGFRSDGTVIYRDKKGRECPRYICYECENPLECDAPIPIYHENRSCPKCDGCLELSRWFACIKCRPELISDAMDAFIFQNVDLAPSTLSYYHV